jgi:hypothetical protein
MQAPCARVDWGEWYLLEMQLAREEAIKAAPAVGNETTPKMEYLQDHKKRARAMLAMWVRGAGRQSQAVHAVRRGFSSTQNGCGSAAPRSDGAEGTHTAGAWEWGEAHEISTQEDCTR